jgi:hypothetical protein
MASTTYYLRSDTPASTLGITLPSVWNTTHWNAEANLSSYQFALLTTPGSSANDIPSVSGVNPSFTIAPAGSSGYAFAQYIASGIVPGTYNSANWTMGVATRCSQCTATHVIAAEFSLYTCSSSGSIKTVLQGGGLIGAGGNYVSLTTGYSNAVSAVTVTVAAGDFLVFEYGIDFTNNAGSGNWTSQSASYVSDCGTVAITSDGQSGVTSPQSFIQAPYALGGGISPSPPPQVLRINNRLATNPLTGQVWFVRNWCKRVKEKAGLWGRMKKKLSRQDFDDLALAMAMS